jgi:hypothetical protein
VDLEIAAEYRLIDGDPEDETYPAAIAARVVPTEWLDTRSIGTATHGGAFVDVGHSDSLADLAEGVAVEMHVADLGADLPVAPLQPLVDRRVGHVEHSVAATADVSNPGCTPRSDRSPREDTGLSRAFGPRRDRRGPNEPETAANCGHRPQVIPLRD